MATSRVGWNAGGQPMGQFVISPVAVESPSPRHHLVDQARHQPTEAKATKQLPRCNPFFVLWLMGFIIHNFWVVIINLLGDIAIRRNRIGALLMRVLLSSVTVPLRHLLPSNSLRFGTGTRLLSRVSTPLLLNPPDSLAMLLSRLPANPLVITV